MATKTCLTCGTEFTDPKHPDRKYCSLHCSSRSRMKRVSIGCLNCGKRFVVQASNSHRKFCSSVCSNRYYQHPDPAKHKTCCCDECGATFTVRHDAPGRFCSSLCRSRFGARQPKPRQYTKRVTVYCEICSKEYTVLKSYYELRGSRYCSVDCKNKGSSLEKMATGNPNYIGGTRHPDRGRNWWSQRRKTLKRDNRTCQICGRTPQKNEKRVVDVHHINPYKNFDGDYLAANELLNLITLCRKCHVQVEEHGYPCPQKMF